LVRFAKSVYEVPISQQYDIAIGGLVSRTPIYTRPAVRHLLFLCAHPVVRPGGTFIIPARCEGAGTGDEEGRFGCVDAPDVQFIWMMPVAMDILPANSAFAMAKVLEQSNVVIVGSECRTWLQPRKMSQQLQWKKPRARRFETGTGL
jgi:hypothetical protein